MKNSGIRNGATVEAEMESALALVTLDRDRQIIRMRWGLENDSPMTLEAISAILHISRERVRQLEARGLKQLNAFSGCLEATKKAVALMETNIFMAGSLASEMVRLGFLQSEGMLASIADFSRAVGLVVSSGSIRVQEGEIAMVMGRVKRLIHKHGIINIAVLKEDVCHKHRQVVTPEWLTGVLDNNGVEWLGNGKEWFTFSISRRNCLENHIQKWLVSSGGCSVANILARIPECVRTYNIHLEFEPLEHYMSTRKWAKRDEFGVYRPVGLDEAKVLGREYGLITRLIRYRNGTVTREQLESACCAPGMNMNMHTFETYLGNVAMFDRLGYALWAIRGEERRRVYAPQASVIVDKKSDAVPVSCPEVITGNHEWPQGSGDLVFQAGAGHGE